MLTALLVLSLLALPQETDAVPPSPFDRVIEFEIATDDPQLIEGRGSTIVHEYEAQFAGALHVWATSDLVLCIQVEDAVDGQVLASDEDSGGGTTPYVNVEVEEGDHLGVLVAGAPNATGSLTLHLMAAPETEESRSAGEWGSEALAEIARLLNAGEHEDARALLANTTEEMMEVEGFAWSDEAAELAWSLGKLAERAGDLPLARRVQSAAMAHRERTLPEHHPDLLDARRYLAITLSRMGDLPRARALFESVLEARKRVLPENHLKLLVARQDVAVAMRLMGDLSGARTHCEAVLEAYERIFPEDHPDLLGARQNLAVAMKEMGDLVGARALCEAVLEGRLRILPADHPDLINARNNLAATMVEMGDYPGARTLFESVLEARERILPADHPDVFRARGHLALAMRMMGDLADARALQEGVLEACERILPVDHSYLLSIRQNLAATMKQMGDVPGARVLEEAVLEVRERTLPADHPHLLIARQNLALTMKSMGEFASARPLEEAVLEARERTLPPDHPDLLVARYNLTATMRRQGDHAGASALLAQLLSGMLQRARSAAMLSPREAREAVGACAVELGPALFLTDPSDAASMRAIFELIETRRAVATLALRTAALTAADDELESLMRELEQARLALNDLVAGGARAGMPADVFRARLDETSAHRDRAERAIRAVLAEKGYEVASLTCDSLSGALPENSILVGFFRVEVWDQEPGSGRLRRGEEHLLAHVLRADGALHRVDLGPASELEALVTGWREALGEPIEGRGRGVVADSPDEEDPGEWSSGRLLRERLIDPVLTIAGEGVTTLLVCPEDLVFLVPLDALPADSADSSSDIRLGDRVRIVVQSSFIRLVAPLPEIGGGHGLLALGSPDYDMAEGAEGKLVEAASPAASAPRGAGMPERFPPSHRPPWRLTRSAGSSNAPSAGNRER